MEIHANIYAVADDASLLPDIQNTFSRTRRLYRVISDRAEPDLALPLSRTWYYLTAYTDAAGDPENWSSSVRQCARQLGEHGAVLICFSSPDHDSYAEFACTDPDGSADVDEDFSLESYTEESGIDDIELLIRELLSGRSESERRALSRRIAKRNAQQALYGDFRIENGMLKKYLADSLVVRIPDGVKEIGEFAFVDEKGYENMLMEDDDYAAPRMQTLMIPEGVTKISDYAFSYCANLTSVVIPDSVKTIGYRAFEGCSSLEHITLPAGLVSLGEYAFFECEKLVSVELPSGLSEIPEGAFDTCVSLKEITVPSSVISIGKSAFSYCMDLEKVVLPKGLKKIGTSAFENCQDLTVIKIPRTVEEIAPDAFDRCHALRGKKLVPGASITEEI